MCGIAGWVDWEADLTRQRRVIEAMTEAVAARGPDAGGIWVSPRAAIGHRRLIVVDPEGGRQPMARQGRERSYVITYNGELYNTPELQRELAARGYAFQGYSDTEVLLLAFIEWGPACLARLNGIFAFAVWCEEEESLFLARDRLGVKPLFYTLQGSAFLFGSELKSLLAHPAVKPELDAEGLAEILIIGPARTPGHGVFRNVRELRPGYWLRYNRQGVSIHQYWKLESRPHPDDSKTTAARVGWLLADTVQRQLVADVPVCALLSGGLDSSAVTAFAAGVFREKGRCPIRTYSIDYVGNERFFAPSEFEPNADAPWAQQMADLLRTDHRTVMIDAEELAKALLPSVRAKDLPGMADIDSSLYLFSRVIKEHDTVGLSGEAADEIFGGYPWFRREADIHAETFPWVRRLSERVQLLSPEVVKLIRPEEYLAERYQEAVKEVPRLPGEEPYAARMREISYLSITRFMPVLLDRKDRMSMAVGLEVRVPYCDHRLVEYAWNIPWEMKHANRTEKAILREALKGVLPKEVLWRRKSPYPKTHNPAYTAVVRQWLLRILADPGSPIRTLLNVPSVRSLAVGDDARSNIPFFGQLMTGPQLMAYLIQVDLWLREYRITLRC
ncbi:MAG TPA: asparagine synthase (glutamine-hydrolyzing) [Desulfotomaculum sp.]|nr:asparagine synthase (glutamine-hydrolyzing) [Desulfotomaculum sp.]